MNNQRKANHLSPGSGSGTQGQTGSPLSGPIGKNSKGWGIAKSGGGKDIDSYGSTTVVANGTSAPQGGGIARGMGSATKGKKFSGVF